MAGFGNCTIKDTSVQAEYGVRKAKECFRAGFESYCEKETSMLTIDLIQYT